MNQSIKLLAALLVLTTPAISSAQELHTFSNGEVADADKINENFQYLLNNGGGCSAAQDGSSVVITCADGTSGVLASAGTVVTSRDGTVGTLIEEFNVGDVVVVDANNVILGRYDGRGRYDPESDTFYRRVVISDEPLLVLAMSPTASGTVKFISPETPTSYFPSIYFEDSDCKGAFFFRG